MIWLILIFSTVLQANLLDATDDLFDAQETLVSSLFPQTKKNHFSNKLEHYYSCHLKTEPSDIKANEKLVSNIYGAVTKRGQIIKIGCAPMQSDVHQFLKKENWASVNLLKKVGRTKLRPSLAFGDNQWCLVKSGSRSKKLSIYCSQEPYRANTWKGKSLSITSDSNPSLSFGQEKWCLSGSKNNNVFIYCSKNINALNSPWSKKIISPLTNLINGDTHLHQDNFQMCLSGRDTKSNVILTCHSPIDENLWIPITLPFTSQRSAPLFSDGKRWCLTTQDINHNVTLRCSQSGDPQISWTANKKIESLGKVSSPAFIASDGQRWCLSTTQGKTISVACTHLPDSHSPLNQTWVRSTDIDKSLGETKKGGAIALVRASCMQAGGTLTLEKSECCPLLKEQQVKEDKVCKPLLNVVDRQIDITDNDCKPEIVNYDKWRQEVDHLKIESFLELFNELDLGNHKKTDLYVKIQNLSQQWLSLLAPGKNNYKLNMEKLLAFREKSRLDLKKKDQEKLKKSYYLLAKSFDFPKDMIERILPYKGSDFIGHLVENLAILLKEKYLRNMFGVHLTHRDELKMYLEEMRINYWKCQHSIPSDCQGNKFVWKTPQSLFFSHNYFSIKGFNQIDDWATYISEIQKHFLKKYGNKTSYNPKGVESMHVKFYKEIIQLTPRHQYLDLKESDALAYILTNANDNIITGSYLSATALVKQTRCLRKIYNKTLEHLQAPIHSSAQNNKNIQHKKNQDSLQIQRKKVEKTQIDADFKNYFTPSIKSSQIKMKALKKNSLKSADFNFLRKKYSAFTKKRSLQNAPFLSWSKSNPSKSLALNKFLNSYQKKNFSMQKKNDNELSIRTEEISLEEMKQSAVIGEKNFSPGKDILGAPAFPTMNKIMNVMRGVPVKSKKEKKSQDTEKNDFREHTGMTIFELVSLAYLELALPRLFENKNH